MLLSELAKYIADNSTLNSSGIFRAHMPPSPHKAACVFEEPGSGPSFTMGTAAASSPAYETPHVQIICRSTSYVTARKQAETIYRLLDGVAGVTMKPSTTSDTGCLYYRIEPLQVPFGLGEDDNGRALVSCNYRVMKNLST